MSKGRQSTASNQTERLEEAWGLGIQGYYEAALEIIHALLAEDPVHVGSLRLRGNLLELKEMDRLEYSGRKLVSSVDYLEARACYEKILQIDPANVKAHIDLGDHYRNLDANDRALEHYRHAMKLLQQANRDENWKEDLQELRKAIALLAKHDRLAAEANALATGCEQAFDTEAPSGNST